MNRQDKIKAVEDIIKKKIFYEDKNFNYFNEETEGRIFFTATAIVDSLGIDKEVSMKCANKLYYDFPQKSFNNGQIKAHQRALDQLANALTEDIIIVKEK